MNKKQIKVMWIAIVIGVLMCLYPPFIYKSKRGMIYGRGYKFITSQRGSLQINTSRLAIQLFILGILSAGIMVTLKTNDKEREKSAYEDNDERTLLNEVQNIGCKFIVDGYRHIADQQQCAPTSETSDKEILAIYKQVGTAFREASDIRGEHLSAGTINYIVWEFLQVKEMLGTEMMYEHLAYEVKKYQEEGLRDDYKQELNLF